MKLSLLVSALTIVAAPVFAVGGDDGHSSSVGIIAKSTGVKRDRASFEGEPNNADQNNKGKEKEVTKKRKVQKQYFEKPQSLLEMIPNEILGQVISKLNTHSAIKSFLSTPTLQRLLPESSRRNAEIYKEMAEDPYVSEAMIPPSTVVSHVFTGSDVILRYRFDTLKEKSLEDAVVSKEAKRIVSWRHLKVLGLTLAKLEQIKSIEFDPIDPKTITPIRMRKTLERLKKTEIGCLKINGMDWAIEEFKEHVLPALCNMENLKGLFIANPFYVYREEDGKNGKFNYIPALGNILQELKSASVPLESLTLDQFYFSRKNIDNLGALISSSPTLKRVVLINSEFKWKNREKLVEIVEKTSDFKLVLKKEFLFLEPDYSERDNFFRALGENEKFDLTEREG